MTAAVQDLCGQVWDARERGELRRDALLLARATALCIAQDVRDCETYDPEMDARVGWLRELTADMRHGPKWRRPKADADAEFRVMLLLGRLQSEASGKERAAGAA